MLRVVLAGIIFLSLVLSAGCTSLAPGQGSIMISSSQSGIDVFLDGGYRGLTPITLQNIPEGLHTMEFRYHNQPGWQTQVYVPKGGSSSVQLVFIGDRLETLIMTPTPTMTPTLADKGTLQATHVPETLTPTPTRTASTNRTPGTTPTITRTKTISPTLTPDEDMGTISPGPTLTSIGTVPASRLTMIEPVVAYKGLGDYITKIQVQVGLRKGADGINMKNPTITLWTSEFSTQPYWEITEKKHANNDDILTEGEVFVYTVSTPKMYANEVFSMSITPEIGEEGILLTRTLPAVIQMDNNL